MNVMMDVLNNIRANVMMGVLNTIRLNVHRN